MIFQHCLAFPRLAVALVIGVLATSALAFPPVPPHTLFGLVRDAIGNPLDTAGEVCFETPAGGVIKTYVASRHEPAVNYELAVPLDAGLTSDLYLPTALRPLAPFRLRVTIGKTTYLPIEMAGDFSKLGRAGGRTRVDLTLGVDEDGNGLPDAWEKAAASFQGRTWVPGGIRATDLYPGSGMSYRDVYFAGTYAVAPTDGFALEIQRSATGLPTLAFTAVKGRTYTVQASETPGEWMEVPFRVLPVSNATEFQDFLTATKTRRFEIEPPVDDDRPARFFRLLVH